MRRILLLLLPAAVMLSCRPRWDPTYFWQKRSTTEEEMKVGQKKIMTWGENPRQKRLVGWFEEWQYKPKGVRKWRTYYRIYDARGVNYVGYATDFGQFYRLTSTGYKSPVGEFKILHTGLKVFFGISLDDNLDLVEIDPYGD